MSADAAFDDSPARVSTTLAAGAAALAIPLLALVTPAPAVLAAAGFALLAAGALRGRVPAITLGAGVQLLAVLLAGATATRTVFPVLLAGTAAVVAWDLGEYGVVLGRQVGRDARTRHAETTHAVLSVVVFAGAAFAVDAVYAVGADGRPVVALVALLVGVLVLLRAFTRD